MLAIKSQGLSLLVTACVAGCGIASTAPQSSLHFQESPLEVRSLQSRTFTAPSEIEILAATVAVLQDMEYNIDRVESPLGVVTASKVVDANSPGEEVGLFMVDLMCALMAGDCDAMSTASDRQLVLLTLVVQPSLANTDKFVARVTMQRVVYDTMERIKLKEAIHEPELYQQIFERLAKSVFLETET